MLRECAIGLRYVVILPLDDYVAGVTGMLTLLRALGFTLVLTCNYWRETQCFSAIRSLVRAPRTNCLFQVNFHTPDTYAARASRLADQNARLSASNPLLKLEYCEAARLNEAALALWQAIPRPSGVDAIGVLRTADSPFFSVPDIPDVAALVCAHAETYQGIPSSADDIAAAKRSAGAELPETPEALAALAEPEMSSSVSAPPSAAATDELLDSLCALGHTPEDYDYLLARAERAFQGMRT